jgi:hypothetical protein
MLTTVGCAVAVLYATGCSGKGGDEAGVAEDGVTQADPSAPAGDAPPATPGSPLPGELQIDAGSPEPQAPARVDPTLRTMWAVDDADQLVRFTSAEPGKVTMVSVTGLAAGEHVLGIDFRPKDGQLYALGTTSRLYVVDRATGAAKAIGAKAFTPSLGGGMYGFDVNPVADKIRVHSDTDQNLRLDPTMGTAVVDGALAFAAGDKNDGQSPNLVATAYTNSVSPAPTATVLYALDSTRNLLTKLPTPNDGKVMTVGALGVDVSDVAGFDIWGGAARPLQAYAALRVGGKTGLYEIDLDKGGAKLVGEIGTKAGLRGLAIEP